MIIVEFVFLSLRYSSVYWTWTYEGLRKEPNMFHNYETEKSTRKASDVCRYMRRAWRSWVEEPNNTL